MSSTSADEPDRLGRGAPSHDDATAEWDRPPALPPPGRPRRSDGRDTDSWLDQLDDGDGPRRARAWLVPVLAVVPWLVIVVVLLRPDPAPAPPMAAAVAASPPTTPSAGHASPAATAAPSQPASAADATAGARPAGEAPVMHLLAGDARTTPGSGDAAAVAVAAARAWLTGVGPGLEVEGIAPVGEQYLEHVTVEAVDHPAPGAAVVSLLAVLLDVDDGAYTAAHARRLAVPVRLDETGAQVAGSPWWLPDPVLAGAPLEPGAAVDDPDLLAEAGAAVTAAGYGDVAVTSLARTDLWPWVAEVTATPPGETGPRDLTLWLRPHLGRLVLAGTVPPPPTAQETRP